MTENVDKLDLSGFLTEWEYFFLCGIESQKYGNIPLSKRQEEKLKEIENKLQDIRKDIKMKIAPASRNVVKSAIKPRSIHLGFFLDLKSNDPRLTILTERQRQAIKNIKDYLIRRARNTKNWKTSRHWCSKEESIAARIDQWLYEDLQRYKKERKTSTQKIIQNAVRLILRNTEFRRNYVHTLREQFKSEWNTSIEAKDLTEYFQTLIAVNPNPVGGNVNLFEKELFTFYFSFIGGFTMSYAVRGIIIHHKDLPLQKEIGANEVFPILFELISDKLEAKVESLLRVNKLNGKEFNFGNATQEFIKMCGLKPLFKRLTNLANKIYSEEEVEA